MLKDDCLISYVNLRHRKDRLHHMEGEIHRVGLNAARTPGYTPQEVMSSIVPPERVQVMFNRTPGAIGCHFSQVRVMKDALAAGKHAWVLEDDVVFCHDLDRRLDHIDAFTQSHDWDILWMGGTVHIGPPHWWTMPPFCRDAETTDDPWMLRTFGAFCTYSYIVNKKSIKKVLNGLDHWLDRSMGIDWAMIMLQPTLLTYMFVPGCCKQFDNMSDIGNGITRFSNFKNLGPYWFANHKDDFDPTTFDWKEAKRAGCEPHTIFPMAEKGIKEPARVFGGAARARRRVASYVNPEQKRQRQQ